MFIEALPPLFQLGSRYAYQLNADATRCVRSVTHSSDAHYVYRDDPARWEKLYNKALRLLFIECWVKIQTKLPERVAIALIETIQPLDSITLSSTLGGPVTISDNLTTWVDDSDYHSLLWADKHGKYDWFPILERNPITNPKIPFLLKYEQPNPNPRKSRTAVPGQRVLLPNDIRRRRKQ
jgi:hypothetical protein